VMTWFSSLSDTVTLESLSLLLYTSFPEHQKGIERDLLKHHLPTRKRYPYYTTK
jgi:hypothetical protein